MAIQSRGYPSVVDYDDFDPGKVAPGQVVIVNILGMHAVYIGTSAGKATRMVEYEEDRRYMQEVLKAAKEAEETRKNAGVAYELMQRLEERVNKLAERAEKASADTDEIAKRAAIDIAEELKKAQASLQGTVNEALEAAARAEKAAETVNNAVENLGDTVRASFAAFAPQAPKKGRKK